MIQMRQEFEETQETYKSFIKETDINTPGGTFFSYRKSFLLINFFIYDWETKFINNKHISEKGKKNQLWSAKSL